MPTWTPPPRTPSWGDGTPRVNRPLPRTACRMSSAAQVQDRTAVAEAWFRTKRAVRKYLNIFRASLVERMAYRGDFLLGTVLRFLPVLTTVLLWNAIYHGATPEN